MPDDATGKDATAPEGSEEAADLAETAELVPETNDTVATEVLDPAQPTVVVEVPPKPKRRKWPFVLVGVLAGVAALLVAAFFIGDALARDYATAYVKQRIIEVLALPADTPVDVTLGEGSIILQALSGAINEVDVTADRLTFGELTGDASVHAEKVPLDGSIPVDRLRITMTIAEDDVRALAGSLSGLELKSIELQDGVIAIGTEFNILGFFVVPVAVDLAPGASEGGITFDPVTIYLGEDQISVADLRNSPEFSAFAGDLLRTQTVCVAGSLPQALTVDDVQVLGTDLVVSVNGDGVALADPRLSTMGTCG